MNVCVCECVCLCALRIALHRKSKSGLDQEEKCVRGTNKSGNPTPPPPLLYITHTHNTRLTDAVKEKSITFIISSFEDWTPADI